nr:PREDICTED: pyruvate dehydrogenase phosphatase regulatory subunit, mitochondrial-like isoform X2 [Bemisia tabaci]
MIGHSISKCPSRPKRHILQQLCLATRSVKEGCSKPPTVGLPTTSSLSSKFGSLASDHVRQSSSVLPTQAQVVICGSGVVANSVAYHLVQHGWTDVLVIDQGSICGGTSNFGSGTLGLFKPIDERHIISNSIKLYRQLQEMGHDIGLKQVGSVNLAQTKDRIIMLKRRIAYNLPTGLHCEIIGPNELQKLHPHICTDNILGGVWVPEDAVVDTLSVCRVLAKLAKQGGASYVENCIVEKISTENNCIKSVTTNRGDVDCEYFVNCAGMWARELGLKSEPKVRIPVYPAEHYYAKTTPISGISDNLPYIRDFDSHIYMREYNGGFLVGGFEPQAKPAFLGHKGVPGDWKKQLPADWDHFKPLWQNAIQRLPILKDVPEPSLMNYPDTFTPNGKWILGETPEVDNYFVAVGMNGNSLQGAGGIGKALAEWIVEGEPTQELLKFDVQRFLDLHNNRNYLQQRIQEVVGRHYSIMYPSQSEFQLARKLRCSPLYSVLEKRGAVFGMRMGYERPLYFDSSYQPGQPLPTMPPGTFFKPKFFDYLLEEYYACREGVGVIDMSSFSKIKIKSGYIPGSHIQAQTPRNVVDWLQRLCSNDVNIPVGGIVHTGMQNERGGYENDCILVREAENSFFMVSPTSQQTRVFEWLRRHLPTDHSVSLNDVTSMYTVINVVGPKARQLLSELSNVDIDLQPFTYKKVNVGYASDVMMMSFTHTGEPGFCLYIPSEYALHVYQQLAAVGVDYGLRDVGTITQRWMRIEKFIPLWGEDLNSFTTPFECGSGYRVKLDNDYFMGKFALQKQKEQGVKKRLVLFQLEGIDPDKDVWAWGSEPIYRDSEFVGIVTSAGFGFTLGKLVCMGYIRRPGQSRRHERLDGHHNDQIVTNQFIMSTSARYEIDIAGQRVLAKPQIYAPKATSINPSSAGLETPYVPKVVISHSNNP